ncbi:gephyrin-like molybdotransferase Glp [Sulfitobacter sp. M368]|uniref:molybdopterin molybdotransferase MoeA n=1 Tax=Sulfitobacter sp. M368 TaxID=2867021 RepID=UPI0021A84F3C|nr:gephyrin-like molybdotransferase Glp [Sulfitobacter sp. M368]UWR16048.1 molybdopterin molybdotransferase MoeA [Sulfitobacter sp. M368]
MTKHEILELPGCGCADAPEVKPLLSVQEALRQIRQATGRVSDTEEWPVGETLGRVLGRDVQAQIMMPPFDNSAMDGYALRRCDCPEDGPFRLPVAQRIAAGQAGQTPLEPGTCTRIFTGAPIPAGADTVVMQEQVQLAGGMAVFDRAPTEGQNIRRAGEDVALGDVIVPAGQVITTRELAAITGAGLAKVQVFRKLRIAVICTGSELARAGETLDPGQIYDVNGPMLKSAVAAIGADLVHQSECPDDKQALAAATAAASEIADLVITTGGVSVGEEDHVHGAIALAGGDLKFAGVAIKPGKPLSFGRIRQAAFLGLPGNPVAAFVTWTLFAKPLCQRLSGAADGLCTARLVRADTPLRHKTGRCEYRPATIVGRDDRGREVVHLGPQVHSAQLAPLVGCDGLVRLPGDVRELPLGSMLEFLPFEG